MKTDFVFVSGNLKKVEYLEKFMGQRVEHHHLDLDEIQTLDPVELVEHKAKLAFAKLKRTVVVEDASLSFNALGKLPGTFVKFFLSEIGCDGMCKLLNVFNDRSAHASITYGIYDGEIYTPIQAEMDGSISDTPRGQRGMGWDPIFIPAGHSKTNAEMTEDEYTDTSVRRKVTLQLKAFLETRVKVDK